MYYLTYRCRKCGQILSKPYEEVPLRPLDRYWTSKAYHDCPERQSDTERVLIDLVSYSEEPLGDILEKA